MHLCCGIFHNILKLRLFVWFNLTILAVIFQIYRDEMLKHKEGFPAYWHKNFALVCERLLRQEGHVEIPRPHLLERTAYHFHIYTTLNPDDPENPNILKALKGFHKQLEKLQKRQAGNKDKKQKSAESVSS